MTLIFSVSCIFICGYKGNTELQACLVFVEIGVPLLKSLEHFFVCSHISPLRVCYLFSSRAYVLQFLKV